MRTQKADPATRARANRGLVTRPLASVLLAMGAVSLAAAPGSAMAALDWRHRRVVLLDPRPRPPPGTR